MDNVTQFPGVKVSDIPATLRALAERTEGATALVFAYQTDDEYFAGSMGRISDLEAVGMAALTLRFFQDEATDD